MSGSVAVIGATGRTGILCVQAVLNAGFTCNAVCRSQEKAYEVFTVVPKSQRQSLNVKEVKDIEDVAAIKEAIKGCNSVIFTACGVSFLGLFNRAGGPKHVDFGGVVTVIEAIKQLKTESELVPKLVLISSLGVTRPYWPIYIMLNTFGGRVMSYKLKGEDALRAAGAEIDYTIIRPGRLVPSEKNPQLKDSELAADQGDKITGQILREDVARIALFAAMNRESGNKSTFELISAQSGNEIKDEHRQNVENSPSKSKDPASLLSNLKTDMQLINCQGELSVLEFIDSNLKMSEISKSSNNHLSPNSLPRGHSSFKTSTSSLKVPSSDGSSSYSSSYRRRLRTKKVAIMSDGKFTVECPDSSSSDPASGIPRRHPLCLEDGELIRSYHPDVTTLYESFTLSVERNGNNPFFGTRGFLGNGKFGDYEWKTYSQVHEIIKKLSMALISLGLESNQAVGLFSINREEWCITEQACFASGLVTVPLYDTLGDKSIVYICDQTEMEIIFTSKDKLKLLSGIFSSIKSVKRIVCFDYLNEEEMATYRQSAEKPEVELIFFGDLLEKGASIPYSPRPPRAEDLCTICYTSGTTGDPKGVMLPHSALLSDASACLALCGYGPNGFSPDQRSLFELKSDDVHISYLPLAHIFERIVMTALTTVGAGIGFYQGDTLKIMEDIAVLRPTIFVSVPRLFNKVYDKVMAGVKQKSSFTQFMFNMAFSSKLENLRENGELKHWFYDRFVFQEIREKLGGRVRAMLSGSAPISPEVMDFLRVCFACEVYEGYGQTETSAGTCLTIRHDWTTGHVGIPAPCNEIKLVDVPDMDYFANDPTHPRGEICVRGPNCFTGYYKDEKNTHDTLDSEGWVHSGDIGEWDARGRLRVIDRKKNMFKLSQGEYIAPERIEAVLTKSPLIAQCFLHGNPLESTTVAVIVPDREGLNRWVHKQLEREPIDPSVLAAGSKLDTPTSEKVIVPGSPAQIDSKDSLISRLANLTFEELCEDPAVHAQIKKEISSFGKTGTDELKGFEIPKAFHLEKEPFSLENNLLTATFKLKRNEAVKKYQTIVDEMYSSIRTSSH